MARPQHTSSPATVMAELAVVGAGGHGFVVAESAMLLQRWTHISFYDDAITSPQSLHGFKCSGTIAALKARLAQVDAPQVVVGIGRNDVRLTLTRELLALGAHLAVVVHPSAVVSPSATLGIGTVVLAGAVINGRSVIGKACIINTRASVDHDCLLEDGVHLSPGTALAGGVTVREAAWVGIGASVIQRVTIGARARVGAGAAVITDVAADGLAIGCPAKVRVT